MKSRKSFQPAQRGVRPAIYGGLFLGLVLVNAGLVSPFLGWYDSGEMVGATICLGISHPSGQVLFHLLGKLFLLLPFGTPAWKLGLMSVFCSGLASILFFHLSLRLAGQNPAPRLTGWQLLLTLAWSFSLPWWRYSLMPLVYALHLLLGMMVLWALSLEKPGKWPLVFFILGAATVFRPTQFFALPLVGLAYLGRLRSAGPKKGPRRSPAFFIKESLFILAAFILGRSTSLYLPLRSALHPDIAFARLTAFPEFIRHLFAIRFSHYVGTVTVATVKAVFLQMVEHLWNDLTVLGVAILLAGLVLLVRDRKKIPVFLWVGLGWGLVEALFVFTIPFPTFESHQVLLGWVFSGLLGSLTLSYLNTWAGKDRGRSLAVGLVMVLLVLVQGFSWGHLSERKMERGAQDYAKNILDLMPSRSLYFPSEENEYFPVVGFQQSFGYRKDVDVLEPGTRPELIGPKIKECVEQGRSLFVSRKWALPAGWSFQAVGPLMKIGRNFPAEVPRKIPPTLEPEALWGKIGLVDAVLSPRQVKAGGKIVITYHWLRRGKSPCDETDSVVALFSDDQGSYWIKNNVFWLHDIHEGPLGGLSRMKPGFEYEEKRILFRAVGFPAGEIPLVRGASVPGFAQADGEGSLWPGVLRKERLSEPGQVHRPGGRGGSGPIFLRGFQSLGNGPLAADIGPGETGERAFRSGGGTGNPSPGRPLIKVRPRFAADSPQHSRKFPSGGHGVLSAVNGFLGSVFYRNYRCSSVANGLAVGFARLYNRRL